VSKISLTLNRSPITKSHSDASTSATDHASRGGKTMPAVPILQRKDGHLPDVPFETVVQLAALAADKLNVVGEDHGESGPRWQKEFDLSVAKTGSGNFWLESMFKLDWSGVHQPDEGKNTQGADPTLERVRYIFAAFAGKLESAFSALDLVLPEPLEPNELDEAFRADLRQAMLKLAKATVDLDTQIDLAVTEELYKHLHYLQRPDSPDTKIGPVNELSRAAGELRAMAIKAALYLDPKVLPGPLEMIARKGKELHDRCQEANWINPRDNRVINSPGEAMDDAKEQRSFVMHLAANKNQAVTGVWKVGEQHVQDIRGLVPDEAIGYNLMNRDEFQEIYEEYYPPAEPVIQNKSAIIQRMYEDAQDDIDLILCAVLRTLDNEERALQIAGLSQLDGVTEENLQSVLTWVKRFEDRAAAPLREALKVGDTAFAQALLNLIANPPKEEEVSLTTVPEDTGATDFEALIREAMDIHVPRVGQMIDEAQERARHSGKKLLVIVGEGHDDPYSRVMVTILVGAMQRLKASRLYIESTPDLVRQHVEPYQHKEPTVDDETDIAHRQHFYRGLYEQGATVTGVDVDKNTVRTSGEEEGEQKAALAEKNVKTRNLGIAKTVAAHDESGVMLVGLSHLAGLAGDETIRSVYEIVTISTMLPEEAETHDYIAYGRVLDTTAGLSGLKDLYPGVAPGLRGAVKAKDAYAIAGKMVIELNQV